MAIINNDLGRLISMLLMFLFLKTKGKVKGTNKQNAPRNVLIFATETLFCFVKLIIEGKHPQWSKTSYSVNTVSYILLL